MGYTIKPTVVLTSTNDGVPRNGSPKPTPAVFKRLLKSLGANMYDLHVPETSFLPQLMKPGEVLLGVLYGKYTYTNYDNKLFGRGLLAATNRRLLFIDCKPLFVHYDEILYGVVSGITHSNVAFGSIVTVSTKMGTISFRTFNTRTLQRFIGAVEQLLFSQGEGARYDNNR
ncbi:hypothetical protein EYC58_00160 [Candidatus Saccharibacteria bacterium]|nr:MAG: hypothetical protein EYC58_00160 [Candidatus Saccharibacteria bacterium]